MTCIIWRKLIDWTLELSADTKTTWWIRRSSKWIRKIAKLWQVLYWASWDSISIDFITELFNFWITTEEWKHWIDSRINAIKFTNFVKENSNIKHHDNSMIDLSFIILHNDFQIEIYSNWQVLDMVYWILSIWSGSPNVYCIHETSNHLWVELDIKDYYSIISKLDYRTWEEFISLKL